MSEESVQVGRKKFRLKASGTEAAYLYFPHYNTPSGATIDVNATINIAGRYQLYLDVDADGNIVGVEVLDYQDCDDG